MTKGISILLLLAVFLAGFLTGGQPAATAGQAVLSFQSFDGGGPEYHIVLDSEIVSWTREKQYSDPDHEEMNGAGFTVTFVFTGVKPGEAVMRVEERSPIGMNQDMVYSVKVDEKLNVSLEQLYTEDPEAMAEMVYVLVIEANGRRFYAEPEDNSSARAFADQLSSGPIEVEMHDYGNFEKVGSLPWELERNDEKITTEPGDVILYQGNRITVYYDENTWDFTRLAKIYGKSREELLEAFGTGDVTMKFWVEWSE